MIAYKMWVGVCGGGREVSITSSELTTCCKISVLVLESKNTGIL